MIDGYVPANDPWPHQARALDKMRGAKAFALLMGMRTGKTFVTTTDFGRLEKAGAVDDFLVSGPAGSYETWVDDFKKHASKDLLRRINIHLWSADQTGKADLHRLSHFMEWHKGPRLLLVNIEALSSVKRARELVLKFASQRRTYGVIDEVTVIKNIDSERSWFVNSKLAPLVDYRRILTGLPTPRSPLDLFGEFYFLDRSILGYENYKTFENRYAEYVRICLLPTKVLVAKLEKRIGSDRLTIEGIGTVKVADLSREHMLLELERRRVFIQTIPKLKGYRNPEELAAKIEPHSFRVRLQDCYDMPEKTYAMRHVELTEEQKRVYSELKKYSTAELESRTYVTAGEVITKILRLHQVLCGHVKDEEGVERELPENRTRELLSLIQEYDGKAIIWCSYDLDINKVAAALRKEYGEDSTARFWGGNRRTREAEERRFKEDPACRFMVATPAAGGMGRTWTVANLIVYYSSTNNLEHRSQSEDRGSGVDKADFVHVVDLVVKGSVDERILHALREKMNLSDVITGDNWRKWVV